MPPGERLVSSPRRGKEERAGGSRHGLTRPVKTWSAAATILLQYPGISCPSPLSSFSQHAIREISARLSLGHMAAAVFAAAAIPFIASVHVAVQYGTKSTILRYHAPPPFILANLPRAASENCPPPFLERPTVAAAPRTFDRQRAALLVLP